MAFLLPACVSILHLLSTSKSRVVGPQALVLAPTRELAIQTKEVADKVVNTVRLNVACIYGGVDKWQQKEALKKGVNIMIATPGR